MTPEFYDFNYEFLVDFWSFHMRARALEISIHHRCVWLAMIHKIQIKWLYILNARKKKLFLNAKKKPINRFHFSFELRTDLNIIWEFMCLLVPFYLCDCCVSKWKCIRTWPKRMRKEEAVASENRFKLILRYYKIYLVAYLSPIQMCMCAYSLRIKIYVHFV